MLLHVTEKQEALVLSWLQQSIAKEDIRPKLCGIYNDADRKMFVTANGYTLFATKWETLPVLAVLPANTVHIVNGKQAIAKSANKYYEATPVEEAAFPDLTSVLALADHDKAAAVLVINRKLLQSMLDMPAKNDKVFLRIFVTPEKAGHVSVESLDGSYIAIGMGCRWVEPVEPVTSETLEE